MLAEKFPSSRLTKATIQVKRLPQREQMANRPTASVASVVQKETLEEMSACLQRDKEAGAGSERFTYLIGNEHPLGYLPVCIQRLFPTVAEQLIFIF